MTCWLGTGCPYLWVNDVFMSLDDLLSKPNLGMVFGLEGVGAIASQLGYHCGGWVLAKCKQVGDAGRQPIDGEMSR